MILPVGVLVPNYARIDLWNQVVVGEYTMSKKLGAALSRPCYQSPTINLHSGIETSLVMLFVTAIA